MEVEATKAEQELSALFKDYVAKEEAILNTLSAAQRAKIGKPIKTIATLDRFNANGKEYIIRQSLTIERFEEFEKLQIQVGYGVDFRGMFGNLRKAYDYLNASQPADAGVLLYNTMNGVKNEIDGRENEVLQLCALFICTENEDLTIFDENLMKAKIDDWKIEGIAMESFFTLAFNLVNGFIPVYNQVSASISEHMEAAKSAAPQKGKSTPMSE